MNYNDKTKTLRASRWFATAKIFILAIAVFTFINLLFLTCGIDVYFLFSASLPYILTILAMSSCGKFPPEYYGSSYPYMNFYPDGYYIAAIIFSLLIIGLYVLCFCMLNKSKLAWTIVTLVLFAVDTVFMAIAYFALSHASGIIDILFHIAALVALSLGVAGAYQLKEIELASKNKQNVSFAPDTTSGDNNEIPENITLPNSQSIREANTNVRGRIFFEQLINGHVVVYRKVKCTSELIIDGYVYGEYTARIQRTHMLKANIDGHEYAVGFDFFSGHMYLMVDGTIVKEKIKFI